MKFIDSFHGGFSMSFGNCTSQNLKVLGTSQAFSEPSKICKAERMATSGRCFFLPTSLNLGRRFVVKGYNSLSSGTYNIDTKHYKTYPFKWCQLENVSNLSVTWQNFVFLFWGLGHVNFREFLTKPTNYQYNPTQWDVPFGGSEPLRLLFLGMSTLQIFWGSWRGDFWGISKQRRAFINCRICKARSTLILHAGMCQGFDLSLVPPFFRNEITFRLWQRWVDLRQRDSIIELLTFMPKAAVSNWQ